MANGTDLVGDANVGFIDGAVGLKKMASNPYYFIRTGRVGGTTLYYFAGGGYYWSSTAVNGSNAYYLTYNSGALYPAYQNDRSLGWSLRCVAELGKYYI